MSVVAPVTPARAPARRAREELAAARARGLGFDEAWQLATWLALTGVPSTERRQWREALAATEPTWRAAYERRGGSPLCGGLDLLADP